MSDNLPQLAKRVGEQEKQINELQTLLSEKIQRLSVIEGLFGQIKIDLETLNTMMKHNNRVTYTLNEHQKGIRERLINHGQRLVELENGEKNDDPTTDSGPIELVDVEK